MTDVDRTYISRSGRSLQMICYQLEVTTMNSYLVILDLVKKHVWDPESGP